MNWEVPPYYFSAMNKALVSDNPWDSIGLTWAVGFARMQNMMSAFMVPNYESTGLCLPFWNSCVGTELLNPGLAINQVMQQMPNIGCGPCGLVGGNVDSFTNSSGMSNPFGFGYTGAGFSDMGASNIGSMSGMMGGMPGMMGGTVGTDGSSGSMFTPWWMQNGGGSTGKTQAEKIANNEYNNLKASAQKIANIKGLDSNVKTTLMNALNKNGTIEEKKAALREAISTIGDKSIFKEGAIVDFKDALIAIGYNFPSLAYFKNADITSNTSKNARHFVDEFKIQMQQGGDIDTLLSACQSYTIPVISCWNDDTSNENIIKYMSKNGGKSIPTDETKNKKAANAIDIMAAGLQSKATALCDGDSNARNLASAQKALVSARGKLNKDGKLTQSQVDELASAFDKLYAQIRMYEAQKVRNEILTKYDSLNSIEKGLIPDDIIVKETIDDLKRERIAVPSNYDRISRPQKAEVKTVEEKSDLDNKPAKTQVNGLVNNGSIKKTANKEIYESETSEGKKYYAITKKDGKEVLTEVKGIKSVEDGKINGEYETVADAIDAKALTVEEVTPTVIQNRVQTKATMEALESNGSIVKKDGKYYSKYRNKDGKREEYTVSQSGAFVKKGTDELVNTNTVPEEDTFTEGQQERLERLIDEGKIYKIEEVPGYDNIYASTGVDSNGHHQYFMLTEKYGLVRINGIVLTNGEVKLNYLNGRRKSISSLGQHKEDFKVINESEILVGTVSETVPEKPKEETKTEEVTKVTKEQEVANEENGVYSLGYQVAQDLIGYTNDKELESVKRSLKTVTSSNVKDFLEGYYKHNGGGNGLFKQLALETKHLKNADVVPVMKAAIDAVPAEYKSTTEYKEATRIYNLYKKKPDKDDFKLDDWGWGWNRIWGEDDVHKFDQAIQKLLSLDGKSIE